MATLLRRPDGLRAVGPMVSLVQLIASSLNTCLVFLVPEDRLFGAQFPNGTWNGIMGLLERQEANMTGLALTMGPGREQVVVIGEWLYQDFRSLTYKYPVPEADIAGFVKPFTMQVWGVFLVTLLAVWLSLLASQTLQTNDGGRTGEGSRAQIVDTNLWNSFLWAYGHPLAQPSAWWPRGGVRLLAGVWLLLTLVLSTIYRSNLKAMLILPHLPLPFDTMEELIASGIPCFVVPDTVLHGNIMRADPKSQYGRLRRNLVVHLDVAKATRDNMQGKHASLASHNSILTIIHNIFKKE
ncbi:glutamate receptor ionotropic, kainate glr-3-like isoform X3 [Eriocheir sinensis]|uniref:glutamate receptor ionotropic, kainate glr-3-like isoform X3 n=1 Tax=Eriocheir sinensis TaxID=95602 RepID=UPI0021C9E16B|nr:glutamate receptor ionotropic, kainate glr-3-like isoform X3 [Eriocheir sinensis]